MGWQWGYTCPEQGPEPFGHVLWEGTGPSVRVGPRVSLVLRQHSRDGGERGRAHGSVSFPAVIKWLHWEPPRGRERLWLGAVLGGSDPAGAFQCDTVFSVEQQREKFRVLLRLWVWICVERWGIRVAGAQVTGPGFRVHTWLAGDWSQDPDSIRGWRLAAQSPLRLWGCEWPRGWLWDTCCQKVPPPWDTGMGTILGKLKGSAAKL